MTIYKFADAYCTTCKTITKQNDNTSHFVCQKCNTKNSLSNFDGTPHPISWKKKEDIQPDHIADVGKMESEDIQPMLNVDWHRKVDFSKYWLSFKDNPPCSTSDAVKIHQRGFVAGFSAKVGDIQPVLRWVKADTKPEYNVGVLVFIPDEDFHITSGMWDISNKWVLLDEYRVPDCEVTHWMPIPEIPEEYKKEQQDNNDIMDFFSKHISKK